MKYDMTTPCDQCPFLKKMSHGFTIRRLKEFASGAFPCHKTAICDDEDGNYYANENSQHCAGALIFNYKRGQSSQMERISQRLGLYDPSNLNLDADVR